MELDKIEKTDIDSVILAEETGPSKDDTSSETNLTGVNPADHLGLLGSVAGKLVQGRLGGTANMQSAAQSRVWVLKNKGYPMEYDDLAQSGFFGLVSAARKHDGESRFSSYAFQAIAISAVRQSDMRSELPIRYPEHVFDGETMRDTIADFVSMDGSVVPDSEGYVSGDEDGTELVWVLGTDNIGRADPLGMEGSIPSQEETYDVEKVYDFLDSSTLNQRERCVLGMRFGFEREPMSLKKVAEVEGVTPERIRQIEAKALAKLRMHSARHQLYLKDFRR